MDMRWIQSKLASVRSTIEHGLSQKHAPHGVLAKVNPPLTETLGHVQDQRDAFPAMGEIADTFLSYVKMADELIHHLESLLEGGPNAGVRETVSAAPDVGTEIPTERAGQSGYELHP